MTNPADGPTEPHFPTNQTAPGRDDFAAKAGLAAGAVGVDDIPGDVFALDLSRAAARLRVAAQAHQDAARALASAASSAPRVSPRASEEKRPQSFFSTAAVPEDFWSLEDLAARARAEADDGRAMLVLAEQLERAANRGTSDESAAIRDDLHGAGS